MSRHKKYPHPYVWNKAKNNYIGGAFEYSNPSVITDEDKIKEIYKGPFEEKKKLLKESHLEMNKYFENIQEWNEEAIIKRAKELIKKALIIWKV